MGLGSLNGTSTQLLFYVNPITCFIGKKLNNSSMNDGNHMCVHSFGNQFIRLNDQL